MTPLVLPRSLRFADVSSTLAALNRTLQAHEGGAGGTVATSTATATEVLRVDGHALSTFDSSALAVLLECQRQVRRRGWQVQWVALPSRLQELARLYGLGEVLGLPEHA